MATGTITIEAAVIDYLTEQTSTMVYVGMISQNSSDSAYPCLVYNLDSSSTDLILSGSSGLASLTFTLSAYGFSYADVVTLCEVARIAIESYSGDLRGFQVLNVVPGIQGMTSTVSVPASGKRVFGRFAEYKIEFIQPYPFQEN